MQKIDAQLHQPKSPGVVGNHENLLFILIYVPDFTGRDEDIGE